MVANPRGIEMIEMRPHGSSTINILANRSCGRCEFGAFRHMAIANESRHGNKTINPIAASEQ